MGSERLDHFGKQEDPAFVGLILMGSDWHRWNTSGCDLVHIGRKWALIRKQLVKDSWAEIQLR
jgi:hypothetical protein